VSGPLASWVGEHSKASWRGRAVLVQYALAAHHDGMPAADVSREDLTRRTGLGRETVKTGRREVIDLGELVELKSPGGRGRVGRYAVAVWSCPPGARCWTCDLLAERGRPAAGLPGSGPRGKGPPQRGKGPPQRRKGPPHGPTTETETYHPQGGTAPPGETDDARSSAPPRGGSAARSGDLFPTGLPDEEVRRELWAQLGREPPAGDRDDQAAVEARRQASLQALERMAAGDVQASARRAAS
jgi:hypothetical protein